MQQPRRRVPQAAITTFTATPSGKRSGPFPSAVCHQQPGGGPSEGRAAFDVAAGLGDCHLVPSPCRATRLGLVQGLLRSCGRPLCSEDSAPGVAGGGQGVQAGRPSAHLVRPRPCRSSPSSLLRRCHRPPAPGGPCHRLSVGDSRSMTRAARGRWFMTTAPRRRNRRQSGGPRANIVGRLRPARTPRPPPANPGGESPLHIWARAQEPLLKAKAHGTAGGGHQTAVTEACGHNKGCTSFRWALRQLEQRAVRSLAHGRAAGARAAEGRPPCCGGKPRVAESGWAPV